MEFNFIVFVGDPRKGSFHQFEPDAGFNSLSLAERYVASQRQENPELRFELIRRGAKWPRLVYPIYVDPNIQGVI